MSNDYEITATFVVRYPKDDWPSMPLVETDVETQLANAIFKSDDRTYEVVCVRDISAQED